MAYANKTDIVEKFPSNRLIELTDDEGDGSEVDNRILAAISRADDKIDSYLRGRFTVPLTTVPQMITDISTELAIYELYRRRGDFVLRSDKIQDRYNQAIKDLISIKRGEITFSTGAEPNEIYHSQTMARVYTAEKLDQY